MLMATYMDREDKKDSMEKGDKKEDMSTCPMCGSKVKKNRFKKPAV